MYEPFQPYVSPTHRVCIASQDWQRHAAARLRRDVFCAEQGIFSGDDRDDIDRIATPIVAVSRMLGEDGHVIGTVRIHPSDNIDEWWGSRLAVARAYRRQAGLGTSLIRLAVSTAHAKGCTRFLAHVQSANVLLFQRLHWWSLGEMSLHGKSHHLMEADLAHYPPIHSGVLDGERRTAAVA
ncbi:MSMEG_0567/Sll0786 family nitrogen starvation N-acetyltransferase [Granulosicoccus sp. 3-233]|uniref:MSMEG_0567/Sll0786 family nitrogen starvation N-acetyltransferase n=1 Tax=Granulosicoccus sp. 3-233 TaxID=3417969 RepID=UPI003D33E698